MACKLIETKDWSSSSCSQELWLAMDVCLLHAMNTLDFNIMRAFVKGCGRYVQSFSLIGHLALDCQCSVPPMVHPIIMGVS
jgi:hypothetical protein